MELGGHGQHAYGSEHKGHVEAAGAGKVKSKAVLTGK